MERGDRVGEYVLKEKIGEGGFAVVWRAEHIEFPEKVVAIKIPTEPSYREYLRREGYAQYKLHHNNIVEVLGGDTGAEPPYLVMEYMRGGSLRSILKRQRRLCLERAIKIFEDVLSALSFAHSKGAVHCDIKPENILIDENGNAKLGDFGLWRFKEEIARKTGISISFLSDEQPRGGTVEYMSPEQRRGEKVTPSDDVYSLGVVLFEMLTGRLPAPNDRVSDFVSVPEWVDTLFERCFVRRERRFQDVASLAAFVDEATKARGRNEKPLVTDSSSVEKCDLQDEEIAPIERPLGCLTVLAILLCGMGGIVVGALSEGPMGAVGGWGIGMLLGAHIGKPNAFILLLVFAVVGAAFGGAVGGLLGAGLAELLIFIKDADRRRKEEK
ncbi:MAG: serine/threonine protein kinase [Planctomycetota bacterium]|nr:serine/threonine protein kinase [Planctomycetota bacterium]